MYVSSLRLLLDGNLDEALDRVHKSNMSKLVDGKPLKRDDGKVLKGPNYKPPYLADLV
jgi:predicted HAD superfamily Cof-like phosphohydrolase